MRWVICQNDMPVAVCSAGTTKEQADNYAKAKELAHPSNTTKGERMYSRVYYYAREVAEIVI
jgi:hypothetical protein